MVGKSLDILEIKLKLDEACKEWGMSRALLYERLITLVDEYGLESVPVQLLRYVRDKELEVNII